MDGWDSVHFADEHFPSVDSFDLRGCFCSLSIRTQTYVNVRVHGIRIEHFSNLNAAWFTLSTAWNACAPEREIASGEVKAPVPPYIAVNL